MGRFLLSFIQIVSFLEQAPNVQLKSEDDNFFPHPAGPIQLVRRHRSEARHGPAPRRASEGHRHVG